MYFLAKNGSKTATTIIAEIDKHDAAWERRHRFANEVCGLKRLGSRLKKGYEILYVRDKWWAIVTPEDVTLPKPWKMKNGKRETQQHWRPDTSKAGKELLKLMESPDYRVATTWTVSAVLGIAPAFKEQALLYPGFMRVAGGVLIETDADYKGMPKDIERVSDIEAEIMLAARKAMSK